MSLKNRLALITGCTGGIGSAAARALAREGCSIAIHYASDSSKAKAEALIEEFTHIAQPDNIAIRASAFQADLSMYDNAKKLYDEVVDTLGHPDIFFGNHGVLGKIIGPDGNVADVSPQIFEEIWRTNTGTNFYLAQLCIPHMEAQKWGRIILTSSVAALNGGLVGPHYASSKAAMHGLIHWLSLRYAKDGICSNAIAPALVEETTRLPRGTDEMRSRIPIGRLGKPDEIASIVVMLVKNAYMTNKVIVADGGWTGGGI